LHNESYGYLVFGVEDKNHEIVGTTFKAKSKKVKGGEDLEHWLSTRLSPRIDYRIFEHDIEEKHIVLFMIPAAIDRPIMFLNTIYIRVGSYTKKLLDYPEKSAKIWRNQGADWSAIVCLDAAIADLSPEAILKAKSLFFSKNPHLLAESLEWDDVKFLNKAKLCIDGKITNTALLLLGLPESEHFINPASATISWILKDENNKEKDYQHFGMPLLLAVEQVYSKIRNLKYRYLRDGSLFPEEVDQYDPYVIREALNNCIAHQDYTIGGKIVVVEREDSVLTFLNSGEFIPQSIRHVIDADAPEQRYRNKFLVSAMVNLKMIDTIGSGIKRMFSIQHQRFFPLPEYDLSAHKVKVTIIGKVMDIHYARKLAQMPNLNLDEIFLLDKIQKNQKIEDQDALNLRKKGLIEGRKPNYCISSSVAADLQKEYIEMRGLSNEHYQGLILKYLKLKKSARRSDLEALLKGKLPQILDESQQKHWLKNQLQSLRKQGLIEVKGLTWRLKL
jgi:ATP-dependent DNA helicase RecG